MADERSPKIQEDVKARKPTIVEQEFMHLLEQKNVERVVNLKRIRRNNKITGLLLGAGVLGIYGYSIYAVGHESFLDNFDEPEKTTE